MYVNEGMRMETMQPTLKNGRIVWDQINMPEAEFRERAKKIIRGMKKEKIDVLLLYGNTFNEYGNPCYVSNFLMRLQREALVVITCKGDVALIFDGASHGLPWARKMTWLKEVRACGDVSKECAEYLKEKRLIPSQVGFVGIRQFMPNKPFEFLSEALRECRVIDTDQLVKEMRMVKSQRECDQIRRASRIVMHAFDYISNTPFPNVSENFLEAEIRREVRFEGAEDFRMMIGRPGEKTWAFRPSEKALLLPGETAIIYLAVAFERYWSEGAYTYVAKDANLTKVSLDGINALYERLVNHIKPGKRSSQVYREAMEEIQRNNYEYIPDYGLGQGVGLSVKEYPSFTGGDDTSLRDGMCFSLRLLVKHGELGAVMIGHTLHLTKKGPILLTGMCPEAPAFKTGLRGTI